MFKYICKLSAVQLCLLILFIITILLLPLYCYYPKVINIYKFILINIPGSSIFYVLTKFFIIYF